MLTIAVSAMLKCQSVVIVLECMTDVWAADSISTDKPVFVVAINAVFPGCVIAYSPAKNSLPGMSILVINNT